MMVDLFPLIGCVVCLVVGVLFVIMSGATANEGDWWASVWSLLIALVCFAGSGSLGIAAFGYQIVPKVATPVQEPPHEPA